MNSTNDISKLPKTESSAFAVVVLGVAVMYVGFGAVPAMAQKAKPEKVTYDDHVRPILMQRCSSCHNAQRQDGDLDISNYTNLMLGGGSGDAIEPGSAEDSYLFRLVTHEDSPEMPPSGDQIPQADIDVLRKWIDGGALQDSGSVAKKRKPKKDYSAVAAADKRPETEPVPSRLPLVPQHVGARASTVHSMVTNPWSGHVAVSSPKQVLIYRLGDLVLRGVIPFPEGQPESIRFSRNGKLLAIGGGQPGASGKVLLWDAIAGRRIGLIGDELDSVLATDINAAQTLVALGGPAKLVRVYGIDGELAYEIEKHTDWVTELQFSPDGKSLVSADRNGGVHVWETETGNELLTLSGHQKAVTSVDWRIDGKLMLTASEDGSVRLWDAKDGKQIKTWNACPQGVTSACFTRDGLIVTGGRDRTVRVWDAKGKKIHEYEKMSDQVTSVAFCSETKRVIMGDWLGQIRVHEKGNRKALGTLDANPPKIAARIKRAEQRLSTASEALAPMERQLATLNSQVTAIEAQNEADTRMRKDAEARLIEIKASLSRADGMLKSNAAKRAAWQQELQRKQNALPKLKASLVSAGEALDSIGEDEDLRATVAKLSAKKNQLNNRIGALTQQLKQANKNRQVSASEIKKLNVEKVQTEKQIAELNRSLTIRAVALGKANDQRSQRQQQLQKARNDAQQPKRQLQRWQQEQQFAKQFSQLQSRLKAAEQAEQEKLDAMAAAEAELQQAKQQSSEFSRAVESIEQQIEALKAK